MIERTLFHIAFSNDWGRQMRFITGPRQSGKTTLAKLKLKKERVERLYYLWDSRSVRNRYKENELFFTQDANLSKNKSWVCFDEIHKMPKWKNILKGIYDQTEQDYRFIVTGSAKFNISRMAGDSLSGRYFTFHLFPLCLGELKNAKRLAKDNPKNASDFIKQRLDHRGGGKEYLSSLLEYGGFPEPFLRQSKKFHRKWSEDYLDRVINEDIGSMTRIIDKEYLYDLYRLLPEMVGSPVSQQSLASHLELSVPTIKNYLKRLADFYLAFKISPYSKNIKRSLLKASKIYLYDWTRIKDQAKRFENYVACEIQTLIHFWMEVSGEKYSLFYVRNKEKQETDFLILKENKPWCLLEAKYSDSVVAGHHHDISFALGGIPLVQVCREEGVALAQKKNIFRISASQLF
ncbi:MAG: ATP-binding protein [Candidatus Omnitrophica bacterium]|nr:ATP-binding protein [Candidatus Omnitrophota bacterium]